MRERETSSKKGRRDPRDYATVSAQICCQGCHEVYPWPQLRSRRTCSDLLLFWMDCRALPFHQCIIHGNSNANGVLIITQYIDDSCHSSSSISLLEADFHLLQR